MQVFITPIAGDQKTGRGGEATVLVPEELFRALVRGEDGRAAAALLLRARSRALQALAATIPNAALLRFLFSLAQAEGLT
jgi:hypothetical protein